MQLRKLFNAEEERAVSPVIGVILMVAITVILAAVIASFVLGLGSSQDVAPTATFDFNYESGASTPHVDVTHTGGDSIRGDELYIRGNSEVATTGEWVADFSGPTSGEVEGESAVTSGDSVQVNVDGGSTPDAYTIRVVWQSTQGDSSSELATDEGPDA
jgi:flagellin-like protein